MMELSDIWTLVIIAVLVALLFELIYNFSGITDLIRIIVIMGVMVSGYLLYEKVKTLETGDSKSLNKAERVFASHLARKDKEIEELRRERSFLLSTAIKSSEAMETPVKKESFKNPQPQKESVKS